MAITPLMPVYPRSPVRPVRGEGVYLFGEQGERYLDFAAGIAVNILGHGHPHLTKAIQEQAATLMHVSNLYGSPQGEAFAKRLCDLTFADTVFFTNSGVEAIECAIKTARRYHYAKGNPHKQDLITFSNAFHGRTMAAMGACLASEKAASGMVIGTHGSTYGGNPLAMAAGQAVFDIVANEEFLASVRQKGERLRSALEQMIPNHDHLFDSVRGVGLLLGVRMKTDSRAFVNYLH